MWTPYRHGGNVSVALETQHQGMEHFCGREGGEAEGDAGGVLEVGAGVGEEDEGHCLFLILGICGVLDKREEFFGEEG